jgi:hypothetical protein
MTTRRVDMERFSVVSSKPFQEILASLKSAVGHPDMAEFATATKNARTFAELEDVVRHGLGKTQLMTFMELDLGAILRKETGLDRPKIVRLVIGNPLIMKRWPSVFPTLDRTPRSRSWLMNGVTAYISLMTGWRVSWALQKCGGARCRSRSRCKN